MYNIDGLSPKYCPPESFTSLILKREITPQVIIFFKYFFQSIKQNK